MIDYGRVHRNKPHLFADAIEIMCVFSNFGYASKSDAFSLIETSIRPAEELLELDEEDLDDNEMSDDLDSAEIVELYQTEVDECFEQLEYRSSCLGECYPFLVNNDALVLRKDLSLNQIIYIFLLSASRTRTFKDKRGLTQRIASKFEEICKNALASLMPAGAKVFSFGPGSDDRKNIFGSDLLEAVPKLAAFMGMRLLSDWKEGEAHQGDGGIDLVGVQKLDDTEEGWNVFIGQCAAREDEANWSKKRSEADIGYYRSWFAPRVRSMPVMFVPVCYRRSSGKWVNSRLTDNVIFMDRVRILKQLAEDVEVGDTVKAFLESEFSDYDSFTKAT